MGESVRDGSPGPLSKETGCYINILFLFWQHLCAIMELEGLKARDTGSGGPSPDAGFFIFASARSAPDLEQWDTKFPLLPVNGTPAFHADPVNLTLRAQAGGASCARPRLPLSPGPFSTTTLPLRARRLTLTMSARFRRFEPPDKFIIADP